MALARTGVLFRALRHAALCALLMTTGLGVSTAQGAAGDAAAKAKFVITFARFVQWPASAFASPDAPLRLCLLHASASVGEAFAVHQGALVGGRPLLIVGPGGDTAGCRLVYVDSSAQRAATLPQAAGEPVLTLGAVDGFVAHGGMVEIVNVDDTLRFDVNLRAMRGAQLAVSSQVLRLARQVRE